MSFCCSFDARGGIVLYDVKGFLQNDRPPYPLSRDEIEDFTKEASGRQFMSIEGPSDSLHWHVPGTVFALQPPPSMAAFHKVSTVCIQIPDWNGVLAIAKNALILNDQLVATKHPYIYVGACLFLLLQPVVLTWPFEACSTLIRIPIFIARWFVRCLGFSNNTGVERSEFIGLWVVSVDLSTFQQIPLPLIIKVLITVDIFPVIQSSQACNPLAPTMKRMKSRRFRCMRSCYR
ncbi:hypothetical protein DFS33DRAFT_224728 [Desarmillaria ectypa]|nr:hypothetical protein DFS33DRAFT_224728 [Desarmillaria ectypa]